jgi:hypothetical protein
MVRLTRALGALGMTDCMRLHAAAMQRPAAFTPPARPLNNPPPPPLVPPCIAQVRSDRRLAQGRARPIDYVTKGLYDLKGRVRGEDEEDYGEDEEAGESRLGWLCVWLVGWLGGWVG